MAPACLFVINPRVGNSSPRIPLGGWHVRPTFVAGGMVEEKGFCVPCLHRPVACLFDVCAMPTSRSSVGMRVGDQLPFWEMNRGQVVAECMGIVDEEQPNICFTHLTPAAFSRSNRRSGTP